MFILDDINSFDIKLTKIFKTGLQPSCDHEGYDGGLFCCISCATPLFNKPSLEHIQHTYYCFKKSENESLFIFDFDLEMELPKVTIKCGACGIRLGFVESTPQGERKKYYVLSRKVFLEINGARCSL
jgi:hypothetical protein